MSSFTKLIAPGVRTGFMIGEPALITALAKVAEDTYISPGYVAQGITAEWCRRGLLAPQIERLKALYAPRLDACLAGHRHLHARSRADAAGRRLLHLADAAGRGQDDRGAGRRCDARDSTSPTEWRSFRKAAASASCACPSAR